MQFPNITQLNSKYIRYWRNLGYLAIFFYSFCKFDLKKKFDKPFTVSLILKNSPKASPKIIEQSE